ncbi:Lymphoid-specific helicase, variant 3 [Clonorchis sinensis]|nr:Lymphoid-specific helicase, variant 3 [Clonorchis sinensis]
MVQWLGTGRSVVRTRPLHLDFSPGLGNPAVSQPSCLFRLARQLSTKRVLQLTDYYYYFVLRIVSLFGIIGLALGCPFLTFLIMSSDEDVVGEFDESHFDELLSVLAKIRVYVEMIEKRVMNDTAEGSEEDPKLVEGAELRDYQRKGISWILTLYENGMNGILADEMGLGKTIQIIAALASLIEAGVPGPYLIVTPLSLLPSWADQFSAFAPRIPCLVYYGAMMERLKLRKSIRKRVRISLNDPIETKDTTIPPKKAPCSNGSELSTIATDSNPNSVLVPSTDALSSAQSGCTSLICSTAESVCSFPSSSLTEDQLKIPIRELQTDPEAIARLDDTISHVLQTFDVKERVLDDTTTSVEDHNGERSLANSTTVHASNEEFSECESISGIPLAVPGATESQSDNTEAVCRSSVCDNAAGGNSASKISSSSPGLDTVEPHTVDSSKLVDLVVVKSQPEENEPKRLTEHTALLTASCSFDTLTSDTPHPVDYANSDSSSLASVRNTGVTWSHNFTNGILPCEFRLLSSPSIHKIDRNKDNLRNLMDTEAPTPDQLIDSLPVEADIKITTPTVAVNTLRKLHTSVDALRNLDNVITEVLLEYSATEAVETTGDAIFEDHSARSPQPTEDPITSNASFDHITPLALNSQSATPIDTRTIHTACPITCDLSPLLEGTVVSTDDNPDRQEHLATNISLTSYQAFSFENETHHQLGTISTASTSPVPAVNLESNLSKNIDLLNEVKAEQDNRAIALAHLDEVITGVLASWEQERPIVEAPQLSSLLTESIIKSEDFTEPVVFTPSDHAAVKLTEDSLSNELKQPYCNDSASTVCSTSAASRRRVDDVFWAYPIVLTSYEVAIRDAKYLQKVPFKGLVVDEGQRLKNPASRLYRRLAKFSTSLRILVTGTPLQNRISELWSLLHFILPEIFTSLEMFEHWFDPVVLSDHAGRDRLVTAEMERSLITRLHCIISPFMLRRTKAETNLLLPPKREILLRVGMTPLQKELYKQALQLCLESQTNQLARHPSKAGSFGSQPGSHGSLTWLDQANIIPDKRRGSNKNNKRLTRQANRIQVQDQRRARKSSPHKMNETSEVVEPSVDTSALSSLPTSYDFLISPRVNLTNGLMLLRRIVNHPYLAIDRPDVAAEPLTDDTCPADHFGSTPSTEQMALIDASEKTRVLDRLLKQLVGNNHKVLIFSQLTIVLDVLEELLEARNWPFVRLDGATKFADRQAAIRRFNYEPVEELPVFLVSARAGGCGLNLQAAANTVVIFDSDWNPQTDLQAQDR